MSSTVLGFIKDISAHNVQAVKQRLQSSSPNQRFTDPRQQSLEYSLLHKAVESGSAEIVAALLAAGADPNAADSRGRTPLHWCDDSKLPAAELLLKQPGIIIDAVTSSNSSSTPLFEAADSGSAALVRLLLKHGAQPLGTGASGLTALHAACMGACAAKPPTASRPAQRPLRAKPPPPAAKTAAAHRPGVHTAAAAAAAASTAAGRVAAGPARAAATAIKTQSVQASNRGPTAAAAAAAAAAGPKAATPVAAAGQSGAGGAGGGCPGGRLSTGVVDALLQAVPGLLGMQDAEGFTALLRLVQHGRGAEAQSLLTRGDCGISAQTSSTGDTALHLLAASSGCSSPPDLQLVAALVAAGADPFQPRSCDGNTPLLLAVRAGGQAGLALAQALLGPGLGGSVAKPKQPQQQEGSYSAQGSSTLWAPLDDAGTNSSSSRSGIDASNTAGETAASVAAAAVLQAFDSQLLDSRDPAVLPCDAGQQQGLLVLLLSRGAELPQQQAAALLHLGLAGQLPDSLTAQVAASLPSMSALQAATASTAATAAAGAFSPSRDPELSFQGLLRAGLYRTAVAWLSKSSGKPPSEIVDAASGNSLLHTAVCGPYDVPGFVSAVVESGVPINAANADHDTALHVAARLGHLQACQTLVAAGADLLRRNGKNRIPGSQLKLAEPIREFLQHAEEAFRAVKEEQRHALWDDKMRATQTESACGIRVT